MQLVEPGTPGEEIDQQTGGGCFDAPDEDRAPSPFQKSFRATSTPTNRGRKPTSPGSTPHRTVWQPYLAEVRIQRQHHRTRFNPGLETLQDIFNLKKMGQLALLLIFISIPPPRGSRTFHLTPCLESTPHSVTRFWIDRLGRGYWIEETTTHHEDQQVQWLSFHTGL